MKSLPPTTDQFARYQQAYDYFNAALFDGELSPCILNFSRHRGSGGFLAPDKWQKDEATTHEISLNPDGLQRPLEETMGILVHEMCHQWQFDFGEPSRGGYHNTSWANKMIEVGLMPSHTGQPGGKMTGQKIRHYVIEKGKFIQALNKMPKEYMLPWLSSGQVDDKPKEKKPKKIKLHCPNEDCKENGQYCWVDNENKDVNCGDCGEQMLFGKELKERRKELKEEDNDY